MARLGYNYQTGSWVWGIEGDVDGANIQANQNVVLPIGGSAFLNEKQNWLASIRGRIGYTWGPGMIYVTGGGAWTGVQVTGGATLLTGGDRQLLYQFDAVGLRVGRRLRVDDRPELVAAW